jgi:acetyl esterase/lipase
MLSYLITKIGRSPYDILISGGSAGGNLAVAVLSHIPHPHPDVAPIKLQQPLLGTMLYSPWVSFKTDYSSFNN